MATKKASKTKKKARKAPAKKTAAKKTSTRKAAPAKKKTATTKKSAAKKSTAKKAAPRKKTAPAKKAPSTKTTASAKKKSAAKKTVKKAPSRKDPPAKTVEPARSAKTASATVIRELEPPMKVKSRKTPANMRSGLRKIKQALLEKRHLLFEQLQAELKEMERPEKRHRADLEEIASDTHDSDSLCQIMDINASQLDQIDAALKKIDESTYGICEDCDEEISLPRLEALPFATQCIECKRKSELTQVRPAEYYSAGFE